jgi:putative transposase
VPARSRTAEDPPTRTPSFVCEVPLQVHSVQEHTLLARLEAARQVYNACLREARTRARLVREAKVFQRARALSKDDPERKRLFREARAHHAFSDYALQAYVQPFLLSWLGEHLDSHTIQKLATRAYAAANRVLVGKAKRVRFKGKAQLDSIEGKVNTSEIRWCGDHVEWRGLVLPALLDPRDVVEAYGLACPVIATRTSWVRPGEWFSCSLANQHDILSAGVSHFRAGVLSIWQHCMGHRRASHSQI